MTVAIDLHNIFIGDHKLTPTESDIVDTLLHARGRVVRNALLVESVYGWRRDGGPGDAENVMKTMICKLRRKLKDSPLEIETVWGVGYRLIDHTTGCRSCPNCGQEVAA